MTSPPRRPNGSGAPAGWRPSGGGALPGRRVLNPDGSGPTVDQGFLPEDAPVPGSPRVGQIEVPGFRTLNERGEGPMAADTLRPVIEEVSADLEEEIGDSADPLEVYNPELKMIPGELQREAVENTAEPSAHETSALKKIVVLGLAAVLVVRGMDWLAEAKQWESKGRFDGPGFDRRMGRVFRKRFGTPVAPILSGLLLTGRGTMGDALAVAYSEDKARPVADAWAKAYAQKVAADYSATSAEALEGLVTEWLNKGLPAPAMASRAREYYGLDPRAANAVARYSEGKGKARLQLIDRYLQARIEANATVYTVGAMNSGREMLFTELIEAGLLPKTTKKVWVTKHDERVCPVCGPMNSVAVPLNTRFHVAGSHLLVPPVHPNCRCTVSVDTKPDAGFVFPRDYTMLHGWLRSATRSVFR